MLKWIKRLFLLILFLFALIIGITFTSENNSLVPLVFFGHQLPSLSMGLWMTIALFLGAIVGFLISFLPGLCNLRAGKYKDKRITQLESEVNRLRIASIKGS